jgi:hypothetical protein
MILGNEEIEDAIMEYLLQRNVVVERNKIFFKAVRRSPEDYIFEATIEDVELPLKEGPYR